MGLLRNSMVSVASWAPRRTLEKLETLAGLALGKGWGGASVSDEVAICLRLLADRKHRPLTVIDVGANVGEWGLAMLSRAPNGTRLIAFDPNGGALSQAEHKLSAWKDVVLVEMAVGHTQSSGILVVPENRSAHGVVLVDSNHEEGAGTRVKVTSLDASASSLYPQGAHILKIDVEGGEWGVLQGGLRTLNSVQVVQFEYGERSLDHRVLFRDFWDFFVSQGFQLWVQTPRGVNQLNSYSVRWEGSTCTNFFARRRTTGG